MTLFPKNQPFSLSIWVKILKEGEKGLIFLNANGDFEGYRGWASLLNEDGTLNFQNATIYEEGKGNDFYRRSMYTIWKRSAPLPAIMNFGAPNRYYCIVSRQKTATPLQSLVLMNDPQYVEAARMLAERTLQESEQTTTDKFNYIFKCLIGRNAGWDFHGDLPNSIRKIAKTVDQPSAALVQDLKQRGMLKIL